MASTGGAPWSDPQAAFQTMMEAMGTQAGPAMERLVAGEGFSELLVHVTENAVALSKIGGDFWEHVLRSFRLAGSADISRLAGQLRRSEDKLEDLLQAIERLEAAQSR
jgi:hypothetical protein